jgi:lipopolysaccharide transport system ATP-binding protein
LSTTAIRVRNLSKQYQIGARERGYRTFQEALIKAVKSPFERFRRLSGRAGAAESFWALRDASFDIQEGEVVGIIGRNGAGKSTLLKILSQITEPTTGEVELHGRVGSLLEVGTGFHPELTGRENVYLNGAILGMKRAEIKRQFDDIVAFAEVEKFLDTPVKRYSSGMYMRLAFAVAAHLEPEILVVDEVLAVGDAAFQKKCLGKMSAVSQQGRTVLFVSHNMNAIEALCTRALMLNAGSVVANSQDVREVILAYLAKSNLRESAEWRNPGNTLGNPWFSPRRFFVGDEDGKVLSFPVRNDSAIYVYVEGDVEQTDSALQVGYRILTSEGFVLYWSLSTDGAESNWPVLHPGRNTLRSRLLPRFLNEGDYRLELCLSLYHRQWLCQPGVDIPAIQFSIQGGLSDSPYWTFARAGVLAPFLPWEQCSSVG